MERKNWVQPITLVQKFEANETVAAQCYYVGCNTSAAEDWEFKYSTAKNHWDSTCGTMYNQIIRDIDGDGTYDEMVENRGGIYGYMKVQGVYLDEYKTPVDLNDINPGDYIYWTTKPGLLTFHHQGEVVVAEAKHPNRS